MAFHDRWDLAIDLSLYQGKVDLPWVVKQQPRVKLFAVKALEMWAEGMRFDDAVDPQFANNIAGADAAGRPVIPYLYYNPRMTLAYNRPFETDQQTQYLIRALNNKLYHGIALDIEKQPYLTGSGYSPAMLAEGVRRQVNFLKHARKNGLIRNVPIGIYSNHYTIKDELGGILFDDVASGFFEFVWEAKWMPLENSITIPWSSVYNHIPGDDFHATALNGIRYWDATNQYAGNMEKKLVIWQYRGGGGDMPGIKLPLTEGGQPQVVDMNFVTVPSDQLYDWLKFTAAPVEPEPPEEPEEPGEPEDPDEPPEYTDLAPILAKLDRLIQQNDEMAARFDTLLEINKEVYNR